MTELERVAFFNGQSLTAEDLNLEQTNTQTLRWLHNRTLHDWGIVSGFGVTGHRGARSVSVAPGMALDRRGREVILSETVVKSIPVVSDALSTTRFYLVAFYVADSDQKVLETRSGVCAAGGAVRLSNDPGIEWRATNTVKEGLELILATVTIGNCKLSKDASGESRRTVRPATQPYIASGETDADATVWTPVVLSPVSVGFSVSIDTSDARFADTPHYSAHIAGERYLASPPGPLFAAPIVSIDNATRTGFTVQALLPQGGVGTKINPAQVRNQQKGPTIFKTLGWHVVWLGVEG